MKKGIMLLIIGFMLLFLASASEIGPNIGSDISPKIKIIQKNSTSVQPANQTTNIISHVNNTLNQDSNIQDSSTDEIPIETDDYNTNTDSNLNLQNQPSLQTNKMNQQTASTSLTQAQIKQELSNNYIIKTKNTSYILPALLALTSLIELVIFVFLVIFYL